MKMEKYLKILLNTQVYRRKISLKKESDLLRKNKNYSTVILIFLVFLLFCDRYFLSFKNEFKV